MTAPTEHEIRAVLEAESRSHPNDNEVTGLSEAIDQLFYTVEYRSLTAEEAEYDDGGPLTHLWGSLLLAEEQRLAEIVEEAKARAYDRARAAIVEEVIAAGLRFAAEYPDAPRAKVPAEA
jgi:hypothetical protein